MAAPRSYRRIVVGLDGSAHSRRAVAFVARLRPPRGGRVACVRVIEPVRLPSRKHYLLLFWRLSKFKKVLR